MTFDGYFHDRLINMSIRGNLSMTLSRPQTQKAPFAMQLRLAGKSGCRRHRDQSDLDFPASHQNVPTEAFYVAAHSAAHADVVLCPALCR